MSEENVELVRAVYSAYARHGVEAVLADAPPEIVWNPVDEGEPIRGHDAIRAYVERWNGAWEELETTAEEFVDGGERVLVSVRHRGRGRGSGIEVEAITYQVHTIRGGKVARMDEFSERAEALEAAGVREQG